MKRPSPFAAVLLAALAGCDSSPYNAPITPHGGVVLTLPDGKGSAEFVKEALAGQDGQARFLVYVYGPDRKPMAPAPTSATFKSATKGIKPVDLKPEGGEPPLASPPVPDPGEVDGELSIAIDGKPITIPIKSR